MTKSVADADLETDAAASRAIIVGAPTDLYSLWRVRQVITPAAVAAAYNECASRQTGNDHAASLIRACLVDDRPDIEDFLNYVPAFWIRSFFSVRRLSLLRASPPQGNLPGQTRGQKHP